MLFVARAAVGGALSLEETLEALARLEAPGFELSGEPGALTPRGARALSAWEGRLCGAGQAFDEPTAPRWRWALGDRDDRRAWGQAAGETLRRAADLGPWPYALEPGPWRAPFQRGRAEPEAQARQALDRYLLAFEPLAALAQARGLALALTVPEDPSHPLADPERAGAFLRRLAAPNLGLRWSVGGGLALAHARRAEPALWAAVAAPHVVQIALRRAGDRAGLPAEGAGEWEALPSAPRAPWILEAPGTGLDPGALAEAASRQAAFAASARDNHSLSSS